MGKKCAYVENFEWSHPVVYWLYIYIYLIYHIFSVNKTYKFEFLLLHVSTYIIHHSGVPLNPDYLQPAFAHLGSQMAYSFRTHTM